MNSFKNFIISFWGKVRPALLNLLQEKLLAYILTKLAVSSSGFKAWLVSLVVEEVIDVSDEYLIEPAFRKVGYYIEVIDGIRIYKRIEDAEDRGAWRDLINDV